MRQKCSKFPHTEENTGCVICNIKPSMEGKRSLICNLHCMESETGKCQLPEFISNLVSRPPKQMTKVWNVCVLSTQLREYGSYQNLPLQLSTQF